MSVIWKLAGDRWIIVHWSDFSLFFRKLVHSFCFGRLLYWDLRNVDYNAPSRLHPHFDAHVVFYIPVVIIYALQPDFSSSIAFNFLYLLWMHVSVSQKFCWGFLLLLHVYLWRLYAFVIIFSRPCNLNDDLLEWVFVFHQKPCTFYFVSILNFSSSEECWLCCSYVTTNSFLWLCHNLQETEKIDIRLL